MSDTIHASAILLPTGGVLLLGASASGKSSLVAQLMTQCGGQLIADDRVCLTVQAGVLHAAAPPELAGQLELRGLGVLCMPYVETAALSLAVNLVPRENVPHVAAEAFFKHQGCALPQLDLHAHDLATPQVILQALTHLPQHGFSAGGVYGATENDINDGNDAAS